MEEVMDAQVTIQAFDAVAHVTFLTRPNFPVLMTRCRRMKQSN